MLWLWIKNPMRTYWSWLRTQPATARRWGPRSRQTDPEPGGRETAGEARGSPLRDRRKQRRSTLVNFPCGSIYIHFALLIPNLINDVKAMTQRCTRLQQRPLHPNSSWAPRGGLTSPVWAMEESHITEKPYWDRDLSRPAECHGVIGCLSLQRVDVQIAGQGDPPGHWDTIEMVIAPLFRLKLQNDFPPHEFIFRSPYTFANVVQARLQKRNYRGYSRLAVVCGFFSVTI